MAYYQMINQQKKFIVLFSPKCACTTLKRWFAESLENKEIVNQQALNKYQISVKRIAQYTGYRKILFVRDPHDRLVSFYCKFIVYYTELWGFADGNKRVNLKGKTFSEFVHILDELWKDGVHFQHHLEPQLAGLESIVPDKIVRIDDLDRELVEISLDLGFEYVPKRLNAGNHSSDVSELVSEWHPNWFHSHGLPRHDCFYNKKLRGIVARIYAPDLACYQSKRLNR